MSDTPALIYLGRIVGIHGIRGWVKIHSECRPRDAIFQYRHFIGEQNNTRHPLLLSEGRIQGKGLIAHFQDIDDRDKAYTLLGMQLYIERTNLPTLGDQEFYWNDLIGMSVINQSDQKLGTVTELFETGANDVVVVQDGQQKEHLIPFILPDVIRLVDFERNTIEVDWELDWLENQS